MLKVAIIGCGDMGSKHAAAWAAREDSHVAAVCDIDAARRDRLAEEYGARAYDDWRQAVGQEGVDVVSICTPACEHRDMTVTAAASGRHVLCEKPMALTLAQADDMIAAASASDVHLHISHQYRGLSRYRIVKDLIEDDVLGAPVYIRFMEMREVRPKLAMHRRSRSGGPIHDMSGHLFDLARYFTGSEPESVTATGAVFGRGKQRLASIDDPGIDTAEIQVRYRGGHCLSVGINWGLPEGTPSYSHEAFHGPKAVAYTDDAHNRDVNLGELSATKTVVVKNAKGVRTIACQADHEGPEVCVDKIVAAIRADVSPRLNGGDGHEALRLILAALESIETGETVYLRARAR